MAVDGPVSGVVVSAGVDEVDEVAGVVVLDVVVEATVMATSAVITVPSGVVNSKETALGSLPPAP